MRHVQGEASVLPQVREILLPPFFGGTDSEESAKYQAYRRSHSFFSIQRFILYCSVLRFCRRRHYPT